MLYGQSTHEKSQCGDSEGRSSSTLAWTWNSQDSEVEDPYQSEQLESNNQQARLRDGECLIDAITLILSSEQTSRSCQDERQLQTRTHIK